MSFRISWPLVSARLVNAKSGIGALQGALKVLKETEYASRSKTAAKAEKRLKTMGTVDLELLSFTHASVEENLGAGPKVSQCL